MININELAIKYKKTKSKIILNQIFSFLQKTIREKAKYIYYQQKFKAKGYVFRLRDTKLVDIEDVEQELNLEIMRVIDNYDITKPFDKYLFSTLWLWKPRFINKDFLNQMKNVHSGLNEDGTYDNSIIENIPVFPKLNEEIKIDELFSNLDERERKILNMLKDNPEIKQDYFAKLFKVTRERISQIYANIRKKYKKEK